MDENHIDTTTYCIYICMNINLILLLYGYMFNIFI